MLLIQSALTILFLFAGMYKGIIYSPIDLTALTGALMCVSFLGDWRLGLRIARQPALWVFAALTVYLLVSGWPLSEFGRYKIEESLFLGVPAYFAAGILVFKDRLKTFGLICAAVSIPISVAVLILSINNDTLAYSINFLSGGYQLTGSVLGIGFFAAIFFRTGQKWLSILAAQAILLGLLSTGSTISTLGAVAISAAVYFWTKLRPDYLRVTIIAAIIMLPSIFLSFVLYEPPSLKRMQLKAENAQAQFQQPATVGASGKVMIDIAGSDTDVTDRIFLFRSALNQWQQHPFFGAGFGSIEYAEGYRTAHNVALELLAEGGITAFVLGAVILIAASGPLVLRRDQSTIFILALFLFTLALAMVGGYFVGRIQMFGLGAAASAAPLVFRRKVQFGRRNGTTRTTVS